MSGIQYLGTFITSASVHTPGLILRDSAQFQLAKYSTESFSSSWLPWSAHRLQKPKISGTAETRVPLSSPVTHHDLGVSLPLCLTLLSFLHLCSWKYPLCRVGSLIPLLVPGPWSSPSAPADAPHPGAHTAPWVKWCWCPGGSSPAPGLGD